MTPAPDFQELYSLFPPGSLPRYSVCSAADIPESFQELLAHSVHMTVTVEQYYRELVKVKVLDRHREGDYYRRRIILTTSTRVVLFGIVAIDLRALPAKAREEIVVEGTPLGRVLIQNNVLTRVQPTSYLEIEADQVFSDLFSIAVGTKLYGRLGVIFADGAPAIEVLEVLAPIALDP